MDFKKIIWIIVLGLVLRMIIAVSAFHPDVRILDFTSSIILREHNLNPYEFFSKLSPTDERKQVYSGETPDDLPLQYWIRVPFDLPLRIFIDSNMEYQFLSGSSTLLGNIAFNLNLLVVKLPVIIFDLLTGIILALYLPLHLRKRGLFLWMINPMSLWATAAVGQVDIMPTFFVVLSLVLLKNGKSQLSALSLGVGGALKSFPFLLFPFLLLTARTWTERIKMTILVAVPTIISVIPYLKSPEFRQNALFAPQMDKSLYAKIPLSGGEAIFITVTALIGLYLLFAHRRQSSVEQSASNTANDFLIFSTAAILLVLSFTHFHIQWFLWVVPFLIILIVKSLNQVQILAVWILAMALILMLFLFEGSLQVQLFAPLFPGLSLSQGLGEILSGDSITLLRSVAVSLFAAAAIFLSCTLLIFSKPQDD